MESDRLKRNKSHYVTEIISWLGFADVIFGGDERQPEIRLRSQVNSEDDDFLDKCALHESEWLHEKASDCIPLS